MATAVGQIDMLGFEMSKSGRGKKKAEGPGEKFVAHENLPWVLEALTAIFCFAKRTPGCWRRNFRAFQT
jgi:hypothetical protein